jgi:hypothetical protein
MNFREHIFLAQCNQQRTIHAEMFLKTAQHIAEVCCLEWGHDFMGARGKRQLCRRCGRSMMDVATNATPASSVRRSPRPIVPILTATVEEHASEAPPKRHGEVRPGERRVFGRTR